MRPHADSPTTAPTGSGADPQTAVSRHRHLTRRTVLRGIGLGGLSLGAAAVLAGCGADAAPETGGEEDAQNPSTPAGDLLEQIRANGVVRIGLEGTFRPYGYHDSTGALVGFEKEIADLIAQDLGVRPEYVETPWDSLIAGVDVGRYDLVINNIAPTDERRKVFDFSIPYALSQGKVGVAEDSPLHHVEEISGHSAAQTETSNFAQMMVRAGARIVPVTSFDEAILLVSYDRIEMTANDQVTFEAFFQQRPTVPIRLLDGNLGEPTESAVLMPQGQERLLAAVNASLRQRMQEGTLAAIYEKYVGQDLTPPASYR